ncbi:MULTISPECIES: nitroreductase [unclassified Paenibacillus]|uniref:nitroreductase family protein n=1 Tax=unclassified Paenibacillus TaxID=185978 RepID=UPI001AE1A8BC|nr:MULTISPECIES: nitroreductase [unclassified Paenibacillus]MBP1156346.1 nitroreductase [Paenibacillus sp. PvP091]MBP1168268.1 nitroreductase [Paenibacillus sp. PvR098]MBP2439296.1 nitroreductase [Paenibacillus sp. PvP052]
MMGSMRLEEAIQGRRSVGRVKQDPISREQIEEVLEAGNWAPSHHGTEPWRFFVMTGKGRQVLADAYADIVSDKAPQLTKEDLEGLRAKQAAKAFRAPVVIAVVVSPTDAKGVIQIEEFAAVHAAVQNMLLTVHALGLGAIWRSGEPMYHARMKQAFKLTDKEEMVGLLYMGIPDMPQPEGKRRPAADKTVWMTD